jgi:hypothetical protein
MNSQERRRIQIFLVSCALISLRPRHWLSRIRWGVFCLFVCLFVCAIDLQTCNLQLATASCNKTCPSIRFVGQFHFTLLHGAGFLSGKLPRCGVGRGKGRGWGWLSDIRSLFQDRPSCHPRRRCWSMLGGSRQEDLLLLLRSSTAPRVQQDDRMTDTLAHSSSPHLSSPALVVKSKVLCIMVTPEDTPIEKGINH